jgi:hypothetical protein
MDEPDVCTEILNSDSDFVVLHWRALRFFKVQSREGNEIAKQN